MNSLQANGISIGYDDRGPADGLPVVLVHGHPFNRSMWDLQADALTRAGHRVITADLRGYGTSEVVPGTVPLSAFAQDTAAVMDRLGVRRAVIGGLSMGGQITMEFHRLFPERVRALILADTSPAAETQEGKAFRNAMADRLLAEGLDGYADEVIDKMVAPYNVTGVPEVARHVLAMMRATSPQGAAAALRGRAERPDYRASLAAAQVPALVVVGADDTYTPVAEARALHALLPDATLAILEGAAHMPNLERPADFNAAVLEFLGRVAR
ncbi:pimeloyl-ACP methyl ester carboxylesterase [Streptomyces sp. V4I23]|uniref:alpha/beta fold hydrolase n=1 Tax=Streptomyces sp. V4I23 TaxID=3042282 RepID=UPI00277E066B|nr:alpha/beta hydrolase [Streptomyces sp. V4I23]MDQ1009934.1 pimeloyl-ACP methyl ester carboxylesterase [Streptomyces sp. V4I23]